MLERVFLTTLVSTLQRGILFLPSEATVAHMVGRKDRASALTQRGLPLHLGGGCYAAVPPCLPLASSLRGVGSNVGCISTSQTSYKRLAHVQNNEFVILISK